MPNVRPNRPKTNQELASGITPFFPGQPELLPYMLYDSGTYTSGTTTSLTLFQTVQTDQTLGNLEAAGQLPDPQYFDLYHLGVNYQVPPLQDFTNNNNGSGLQTSAINDVYGLLNGSLEFIIAQKRYWFGKQSYCPWGAGVWANMSGITTPLNSPSMAILTLAMNGFPYVKNRNCFWGVITIPPKQNFKAILTWTAALTLANGNTTTMVGLDGYLYRRVL